jgi:hypothetical protein
MEEEILRLYRDLAVEKGLAAPLSRHAELA